MKKRMWLGSFILTGVLAFGVYGISKGIASGIDDRDHDDEAYEYGYRNAQVQSASRFQAESKLYHEECGSCHLAYPPQLLPPESWEKIMSRLDDHFGENAELDEATRDKLESYLMMVSTPRGEGYRRTLRNLDPTKVPVRITEMVYFKRKHREIPDRLVRGNDKVRSLSQCDACHRDANKGYFDEDNVIIPGAGRWDD